MPGVLAVTVRWTEVMEKPSPSLRSPTRSPQEIADCRLDFYLHALRDTDRRDARCNLLPRLRTEGPVHNWQRAALNSILIIVDQAAVNAGFDFWRWAALADNDF